MSKSITWQARNELLKSVFPKRDPLRAPCIDEAENDKISYAALQYGLTFRIPFVSGMGKGDKYIAAISSEVGNAAITGTIQDDNQDVVVRFAPERISHLQGQVVEAWHINHSWPSLESRSPIKSYEVEGWLFDPKVDEAEGSVIPSPVAALGANLRIRSGLAMKEGAVVSSYFLSSNSRSCFVDHQIIAPGDVGKDIVIPVAPGYLEKSRDGVVHMIYSVHSDQGTSTSRLVTLNVEGTIAKPQSRYLDREGYVIFDLILPYDENGKIPMMVQTRGMAAGNQLTMFIYQNEWASASFIVDKVTQPDMDQGYKNLDFPGLIPESGSLFLCALVVEGQSGEAFGSVNNFEVI